MIRYFAAVLFGAFATLAALWGTYAVVRWAWPERLPPPAISRLVSLDEKLRFIRERPGLNPEILAVGSSITWRQLDGRALVGSGRDDVFLNGGTGLLKTHQSQAILNWYLRRFSRIHTVIQLVGLPDFDDCTSMPAELFDPQDADAYAFARKPAWPFYLKYFTPLRYLRSAHGKPAKQIPYKGQEWLDPFGSSPLIVPASRKLGLRYGPMEVDRACIDAVISMSADLNARGIRYMLVFAPVNPEYRARYPESDAASRDLIARLKSAVERHGTQTIVVYDDPDFDREDFYDAFHLQAPAVERLSRRIASAAYRKQADVRINW